MFETCHFVDNYVRGLVEDRIEIWRLLKIFLSQTLRGQLDRRQRVLNLMSHPSSHLLPGCYFLRLDQLREIFEHQYDTEVLIRFILHT